MNGMAQQQPQHQPGGNPQQGQPQPIYGIPYGAQQQNMNGPTPQQAQAYPKENQISNPFIITSAAGNANNNNTNSTSSIKSLDNNFDHSHSLLFMEKPPQAQQNSNIMIEQNQAQNTILMNEPSQNPQSQTPNSILMNDSQLPPQQQSNMPNNFNPFLIQTPLMQNETNTNTYYQQNRQANDINLVNTFNNTPPILNNKSNSPSMAFRSLSSPTMNQQNNQQNFTQYSHNSQAVVHQQSLPTPNSTPTTAPIVPVMQKSVNPNQPAQQLTISSFPPRSTLINNQNQNMTSTAVTTQQNNAPAWGGNNMNNTQMVHTQVINESQNTWNGSSPPIINQNNQNIYQGIPNNSNWQPNYNNEPHANTQSHENVIYY